jgi:uncharacterized membrane protein
VYYGNSQYYGIMNTDKVAIMLIVVVVGILGTAVSIYEITASPSAPVAQFTDANIVGPNFESDVIPKLKVGEYAIITVNIEKLGEAPINDIMVKSYLEDTASRKFLFIDGRKQHPGVNEKDLNITGEKVMVKVDQFDATGKTEPVMIKVMATDFPPSEFDETVNVVLYADGKEMDRVSFDVIVNSRT